MGRVGLLLLSVLLIIATEFSTVKAKARYTRYTIQFYEWIPTADPEVFKPVVNDPIQYKGIGYVKHNVISANRNGELAIGWDAGQYFYHSTSEIENVVTIHFSNQMSGIWNGSSINLRGLWYMTADGNSDLDDQELSIVGGEGGFRGASGSVYYHKVALNPTVYHITADIIVDNIWSTMPAEEIDVNTVIDKSAAQEVVLNP